MGQKYCQLRLAERFEICRLHSAGWSLRKIGRQLGRSASTIGRELDRNSKDTKAWRGGYEPERAERLAQRRRRWDCRFKLARQPALREFVRDRLAMGRSPQQISGRLALDNAPIQISHESIYRFAYHRSAQGDYWHRLLPKRKNRRGRLRRGGISPVLHIKQRRPVQTRPASAEDRSQPGHWEADLMCFRGYGQIVVVHERASRILLASHQPTKTADAVLAKLRRLLGPLPPALRQTITFDNGTEFAFHYRLASALGIDTFFCDPHAPWQKGGVENAISRLRRDLPRKTCIDDVSTRKLDRIIAKYNATPRRCLGYKSPAEVFWNILTPLHFKRETTCPPPRA